MFDGNIIIDDAEIKAKLAKLAGLMKNLRPVMLEIGNMIRNETELSFEDEKTPWGTKWEPLSAVTIARKEHSKILTDSGQLSSSFTVRADNDSATVGTNKIYAAIHNFGGDAGRNKAVKIPARQYLPVDKAGRLEPSVERAIISYLTRKIRQATA